MNVPHPKIFNVPVAWEKLHPDAHVPVYSSDQAAGADLCAVFYPDDYVAPPTSGEKAIALLPGERRLFKTGISIELPEGYEAQVRSRSGLALKHGIMVLNSPGTIDSDYRGEIGVILYNTGKRTFYVNPGDRIAQLVIAPVVTALFFAAGGTLSATERGEAGFGSTGVAQSIQ